MQLHAKDDPMPILPLHASLDFHDGIAALILVLTLALGSFLSSLRRRQRHPTPHAGDRLETDSSLRSE
jgi:hypothetical protein